MRGTTEGSVAGLIAIAAVAGLFLAVGAASAGGSGYNLSYTAPTNSNIIPAVDLVSVSTNYTSGPNLTASLTVAGTPITNNFTYSYFWLFGGGATGNSTAWAFVDNGSAYLHSSGFLPVAINYTVAGSTLSISVATAVVGPSAGFTFNGEASKGNSPNPSTYSFLGTNYAGSGTCSGGSCSGSGPGTGSSSAPFPIGAIIWPVVIVVVILIVILMVRRRRRPPTSPNPTPTMPGTASAGSPPAPPPPSNP